MPKLTVQQVEMVLNALLQGLEPAIFTQGPGVPEDPSAYYQALYPEGVTEEDLAACAGQYPALHTLMAEVVEAIITLTGGAVYDLWSDAENQAGSQLACALAVCDKQYCRLFADCLAGQDTEHESYQLNDEIDQIIAKWGFCDETGLILQARWANRGNSGQDYLREMRQMHGEDVERYFEQDAEWAECWAEEDEGRVAEVDIRQNSGLQILDKMTLELIELAWDEGSDCILIACGGNRYQLWQYKSAAALRAAVYALDLRCIKQGYARRYLAHPAPTAIKTAKRHGATAQPAGDAGELLALFTPRTERAAAEKRELAQHPHVPCKKVQLFNEHDFTHITLLCDTRGRRILRMPAADDGQYLWQYDTDRELGKAFAELGRGYRSSGYAEVLKVNLAYPFEHFLEQTKQAVEQLRQADGAGSDAAAAPSESGQPDGGLTYSTGENPALAQYIVGEIAAHKAACPPAIVAQCLEEYESFSSHIVFKMPGQLMVTLHRDDPAQDAGEFGVTFLFNHATKPKTAMVLVLHEDNQMHPLTYTPAMARLTEALLKKL